MSSRNSAVGQTAVGGRRHDADRIAEPAIPSLASAKIQPAHLERLAIVYVRQSTAVQVIEHRESRARQYALADCAVLLGWARERVLVIDEDQGHSGQTAENRPGFQRLLTEVTLDHVGLVVGLEMSRLARSNKDWHHLLELCAIFGTLLGDQEGVYDPRDPNDRLVLGLKGTMSELEIHTMRNRLEKGKLHKAQRGELFIQAPMGYVKTASGELALDPDEQVRAVVALVFDKFDELGTLGRVFRYLLRHGIRMGIRLQQGPNRGQLEWRRPSLHTLNGMFHHPFYAGTYAYGRRVIDPKRKHGGHSSRGRKCTRMDEWKVVKHDHLPAYITYERYLRNQETLHQNRSRPDAAGAIRRGTALLSGLVFCGRCGTRLRVVYCNARPGGTRQARYECLRYHLHGLERTCHGVTASAIDALVTQQVLRALEPAALDLSLRAGDDVQREREQLTLHWRQQLERAHYEAARAERHYRAVDPENRLVARTLEQQWERALRHEQQLQEEYDRFLRQAPAQLTSGERDRIRALATDIPALWSAPATTPVDRKELIRCLLERVVVTVQGNTEHVDVTLHWAGGFVSQHQVRRPVKAYEQLHNHDQLVEQVRQLREAGHSAAQIAERLNEAGFRPASKARFDAHRMRQLLSRWGLSGGLDDEHVLGPQEWRLSELAKELKIHPSKIRRWARLGWVHARRPRVVWSYIVWADREELERLRRLRDHSEARPFAPYPAELTTRKAKRTARAKR
jgi:DNA invertase Pin-like site-specific DNA recombinase